MNQLKRWFTMKNKWFTTKSMGSFGWLTYHYQLEPLWILTKKTIELSTPLNPWIPQLVELTAPRHPRPSQRRPRPMWPRCEPLRRTRARPHHATPRRRHRGLLPLGWHGDWGVLGPCWDACCSCYMVVVYAHKKHHVGVFMRIKNHHVVVKYYHFCSLHCWWHFCSLHGWWRKTWWWKQMLIMIHNVHNGLIMMTSLWMLFLVVVSCSWSLWWCGRRSKAGPK